MFENCVLYLQCNQKFCYICHVILISKYMIYHCIHRQSFNDDTQTPSFPYFIGCMLCMCRPFISSDEIYMLTFSLWLIRICIICISFWLLNFKHICFAVVRVLWQTYNDEFLSFVHIVNVCCGILQNKKKTPREHKKNLRLVKTCVNAVFLCLVSTTKMKRNVKEYEKKIKKKNLFVFIKYSVQVFGRIF